VGVGFSFITGYGPTTLPLRFHNSEGKAVIIPDCSLNVHYLIKDSIVVPVLSQSRCVFPSLSVR